jgi:hypothetical protein
MKLEMQTVPNSHAVRTDLGDPAVGAGRTLCMSSFRVASEGLEGEEGDLGWI